MNIPSRKSRSLVITVLLAAASVAYVFFVFLPGQKAIAKLRRELDEKQQYIVDADRLAHAIQLAEKDLRRAEDFTTAWRAAAPNDGELAPILGRITGEVEACGVGIERLDRRPVKQYEEVGQIPIVLECEGSFQQIFDLTRRLEAMPQDLWITSLRIETQGKNSESVLAEVALAVFADNSEDSD
ncbi:MAG: type 4a pilus biogenesis protein PilO [Pirellulaceae bacterium]